MFSRGSYPEESYLSGKYLGKGYPDGKVPGWKGPRVETICSGSYPGEKVKQWNIKYLRSAGVA